MKTKKSTRPYNMLRTFGTFFLLYLYNGTILINVLHMFIYSEETYRHRVEVDGQNILLEILDTAGQVSPLTASVAICISLVCNSTLST